MPPRRDSILDLSIHTSTIEPQLHCSTKYGCINKSKLRSLLARTYIYGCKTADLLRWFGSPFTTVVAAEPRRRAFPAAGGSGGGSKVWHGGRREQKSSERSKWARAPGILLSRIYRQLVARGPRESDASPSADISAAAPAAAASASGSTGPRNSGASDARGIGPI